MKGSGIALALTVGCAANTALLLVFLARASGSALRTLAPSAFYALKVAVFSAAASVPVLLLAPVLNGLFAEYTGSRFVRYGVPLGLEALLFAATGITMLAVSRDRQLVALLALADRKRKRNVEG
jgi:peptidoglycan biosynthesis protein MviN/MurJ (putative lipid II flippase)